MGDGRASRGRIRREILTVPLKEANGGDDSEESWTRELEREMEQGEPAESDDLPLNASRGLAAGASNDPSANGGDDSDSEESWTRELEQEMEQGEPAESDDLQIG